MITDEAFNIADAAYTETLVRLRQAEHAGYPAPFQRSRALRAAVEAAINFEATTHVGASSIQGEK